jgi:hypothetical protein
MGLLDKVKNLFTEEVEEEVPIKKEVKHVEITNPRREVIKEEPVVEKEEKKEVLSDSLALNREEKFKFPVYFDDKDFEDLPKREEKKKREPVKEKEKVEPYKAAKMVEEKKNFKPSPIISPVYGILDKNYKKDDITAKKEKVNRYHKKEETLTVDDVRRKAYGTLEDELEDTLFASEPLVFEQEQGTEAEIDIFKELEDADHKQVNRSDDEVTEETVDLGKELEKQKQKIEEINEFIKQNTVAKEKVETPIEEDKPVFETVPEEKEELENGDLFNLIDSMYEKREEE